MAKDECFPAVFHQMFENLEVSDDTSKEISVEMKNLILKFKASSLCIFRKVLPCCDKTFLVGQQLLMMELFNKQLSSHKNKVLVGKVKSSGTGGQTMSQ